VVTLTGIVPSYGQKIAAQNAAHRVSGVLDLVNELIVKSPHKYGDAEIARAVRQALEWDVLVPEEQIQATVSDGWVKLEGQVNSLQQSDDAQRAVLNLAGVAGVINALRIESPKINPDDLRKSIEEALERRAEREAERLRIDVKDGEIDLYGRVHSWRERRAVVGSISHAPGVKKINDKLRIDPYF
jgi:osmotically-inducible protein OsmY